MERALAAQEAIERPPACLSHFSLNEMPLSEDQIDVAIGFALTCKSCGAGTFKIRGFPLVAPDPSPYWSIEPGELFFRPPHKAKCTSCNSTMPIFDARTQGYDGVLNGGCCYESGDDGEADMPGEFTLSVWVIYNIELEELQQLASEAKVNPSDLFDAFVIEGKSIDGNSDVELYFECA